MEKSPTVEKGTLIELRVHGDRRLAVVERPEGKKHLIAIDENGTAHTVHPRDIEYIIPRSPEEGRPIAPSQIPQFLQQVQPFLDPSSLEVAWEILVEDRQAVTPDSLANLLFSEVNSVTCYAAHCLLGDDKLYFKQKGAAYEPRTVAQVGDLKHQIEAVQQRALEAERFQAKLRQALAGSPVTWEPSDRLKLDALERFALHGEEASDKQVAGDLLASLDRARTEDAAFQLLVDLGIWHRHENLPLRRSQIPTRFSAEVLDWANTAIASPVADPMPRVDLTHLHVYTIDDESTKEIDDGLSVEPLGNGKKRIWIHIADPTRWVQPGDPLDREARRRATSLYLPTGAIPMFPPELATGPMSLVQGQICHALSFGVELHEDGSVARYDICSSYIRPTYRLTYEDAEEMVQMGVESDLDDLAAFARLRFRYRLERGAIHIQLPEAIIEADPHHDDRLVAYPLEDLFSRQLVAEMMILAGEVAASFARDVSIPIPYRSQEQPSLPPAEVLAQLPPGPVRDFAICRCMVRGTVGTLPSPHAGLGLEAYAQVTSPIRRYTDAIAHQQIKAFLAEQPLPYSIKDIDDLLVMLEPALYEATQVERQTQRYWSLEYLRRHRNKVWQGILLDWLREHEKLGLVLLEDVGFKLPVRLARQASVGEQLRLAVSDVDPRRDVIVFQEVQAESALQASICAV